VLSIIPSLRDEVDFWELQPGVALRSTPGYFQRLPAGGEKPFWKFIAHKQERYCAQKAGRFRGPQVIEHCC
jgi:hypothetical protein